jgi:hypothetical protein
MIKLTDILLELEKPKKIYQGTEPEHDDSFMKRGFKLGKATIDPETGASVTDVINLPEFEQIRRKIIMMRKEFQAFKFSSNPDIAKLSKDINTNMTKLSQMIFALDKMIELQNKK